jgi:flagellar biogenesis protein FliO
MRLVISRHHRRLLRARTVAALVFTFALPSLASSFEGPFYETGNAASASLSDVRAAELNAADHERPTRRLTPKGETAADDGTKRSRLPSAGSVLSALALVTLAIFAIARLWKIHGPKLPVGVPREAAEVLGRCRIEAKQSLYLVLLGSRVLVLGSANGELSMLTEITDATEVDLISAQCQTGGGTASPFSRLFAARQAGEAERTAEPTPTPFASRPTFGTAERRLAERFRGHVSEQEAGRAA